MPITLQAVQTVITQANRPNLVPHAPLLTQIVNIYIAHHAGAQEWFEDFVLREIVNGFPQGVLLPLQVRALTVDLCSLWSFVENQEAAVVQIMQLQVGGPPAPPLQLPPTRQQHLGDIQRLRGLRTQLARNRGRLLVAAARRMRGWFHWVASGPVSRGLVKRTPDPGPLYGPRERWDHTKKDVGWEQHELRRNDFAAWMNGNGPIPSPLARMNCWEAVMFSAYRAGLMSEDRLRFIHRQAAIANALGGGKGTHYDRALANALGCRESVPFVPSVGLVPYEGDILYWGDTDHVAISLGRHWVNGRAEDRVMSHWHNNNGTFSELTVEDFHGSMRTGFRFRPCPF